MIAALHPWRRFRALGDAWRLAWHDADDNADYGVTDFETGTISLRVDLDWAQRRCTILHETLHAERGPVLDTLVEREELRVRKETARLLLPNIHVVADALIWSQRRKREAADVLGVDVDTLWDRLDYLHPSEIHYLRRRLADF